jgi:hypothetical protein
VKIAYNLFFYGDVNAIGILDKKENNKEFIEYFTNIINGFKGEYNIQFYNEFHLTVVPELEVSSVKDGLMKYAAHYPLFIGHYSHLGHYFRHLFQTVKYVVTHAALDESSKLEYLRTLRAQLSDYEQLLLYYNGLSEMGRKWNDNDYFTTYRMIHNLPLPLADFGVKPQDKYRKEIADLQAQRRFLFEWQENTERSV